MWFFFYSQFKMSDDRVSYMYQRDPSIDRRYRPRPNNVRDLYKEIDEEEIENETQNTNSQTSASSLGSIDVGDGSASVFLRLRPNRKPCKNYAVEKNTLKVHAVENMATNNKDLSEKHFEFSNIFNNDASQFDIYNHCVNTSIEHEENLTVLTYGTSGSGKTYTMYGSETNAGIVQRALVHIFTNYSNVICDIPAMKLEKGNIILVDGENCQAEGQIRARFVSDDPGKKNYDRMCQTIRDAHDFTPVADDGQNAFIWLSFVEIYNENVYDLLNPSDNSQGKRKNLKIIANDGNSFVKDLTSVHVRSADEAFAVINCGLDQVKYASTNINTNSSRSHCILIANIIQFTPPDRYSTVTYRFCDLAGSERLKKTDAIGNRLKEAQRINTSLLVLGRCLDLLYHNQQMKTKEVVPFRESKLTLLLQRSLIGREKIITIVNMMPQIEFMDENLHVLNFASIAQKIVYNIPKPPKPPTRRAARSTRFSWFLNSQRTDQRNENDWNAVLNENEQLENENLELRAQIQRNAAEYSKAEQDLRNKFVEEREQQLKKANEKWEKHCKYLETRSNERVSIFWSFFFFIEFEFNLISFTQIAELEAEVVNLRTKLFQKMKETVTIDIDDDDDDEDDETEEDSYNVPNGNASTIRNA